MLIAGDKKQENDASKQYRNALHRPVLVTLWAHFEEIVPLSEIVRAVYR